MLLAAFALAGCADSVAGYAASFSDSGTLRITEGPQDGDLVTFRMPRTGLSPTRQPVYARPGRTIRKLAGCMPVGPDAADETDGAFAVSFRLPESGPSHPRQPPEAGGGFPAECDLALARGSRTVRAGGD